MCASDIDHDEIDRGWINSKVASSWFWGHFSFIFEAQIVPTKMLKVPACLMEFEFLWTNIIISTLAPHLLGNEAAIRHGCYQLHCWCRWWHRETSIYWCGHRPIHWKASDSCKGRWSLPWSQRLILRPLSVSQSNPSAFTFLGRFLVVEINSIDKAPD